MGEIREVVVLNRMVTIVSLKVTFEQTAGSGGISQSVIQGKNVSSRRTASAKALGWGPAWYV